MRLRNRFFLFAVSLHGVMAIMAAFLLQYNTLLFLISEALIVVSIIITIGLYKAFVKPLNIMAAGLESLNEKDFSIKFVKIGHYEIDQLIEVYNKMIDQLREERIEVNEQHHFLDKLIQASPSGILIFDYENKIQSVNPAALDFLGVSSKDLIGKNPEEISHPITLQLAPITSKESTIVLRSGIKTFKCHKGHFINKGFHQCFIIIEELTNEILLAEKKAYEKVIRMMSHEINNTVGAVNSMLSSVKQTKFKDDEDYGELLQVCIDRNRRMSKFMGNFSEVVKLPEPRKEKQDLHELLRSIVVLFSDACRSRKIILISDLDGADFPLLFDAPQMEQALINILKNAMEAIGEKGQIAIITSRDHHNLIIRDTGKGIDDQTRSKLFSPFFSTKKEGQGIGLTLTKEILYRHNFQFSLETKKEGCTEFQIDFGRA